MEGSRLRILNLLLHRKQATVEQLSREMGLASATVRRHLDILQRDSLITYHQLKKRTGRPEHVYYLTEEGQECLPKGYNVLLSRLLQKLSDLSSQEVQCDGGGDLLRRLFQQIAQETVHQAQVPANATFDQRLERAMALLQAEQFLPHIEERPLGLSLRLHNCPFRSVALSNPDVCEYDHMLISFIMGAPVERESCIRAGDQGCCYRLSPSTTTANAK